MTKSAERPAGQPPVWCKYDKLLAPEDVQPPAVPYREHPAWQVDLLAGIIRAAGFRRPIVISKRSGKIVKGYGIWLAAKILHVRNLPVVWQNYESEQAEILDGIADNRASELGQPNHRVIHQAVRRLPHQYTQQAGYIEPTFTVLKLAKEPGHVARIMGEKAIRLTGAAARQWRRFRRNEPVASDDEAVKMLLASWRKRRA
jgi:hypothetical protein